MFGWHHQCSGRELGQTLGDGEWQGSLVFCSPWGCKVSTGLGYWTTTRRRDFKSSKSKERSYKQVNLHKTLWISQQKLFMSEETDMFKILKKKKKLSKKTIMFQWPFRNEWGMQTFLTKKEKTWGNSLHKTSPTQYAKRSSLDENKMMQHYKNIRSVKLTGNGKCIVKIGFCNTAMVIHNSHTIVL